MAEAFKHNLSFSEIEQVLGYSKCLGNLYSYIAAKTAFNPEKRMIDAVDLLDTITATNDEITELMKAAKYNLELISSKINDKENGK